MKQAITKLHRVHNVPHILITSIRLPPTRANTPTTASEDSSTSAKLSVIGSTATSDSKPRLFRITVPALPVFFSGTGDMFAATLVARLRQASRQAGVLDKPSWRSEDSVAGPELPLAKAAEKVLASMQAILKNTAQHYNAVAQKLTDESNLEGSNQTGADSKEAKEVQRHLRLTRAAEVRVVRNAKALLEPPDLGSFKAQEVIVDAEE
jgi:pyridoxine kinase